MEKKKNTIGISFCLLGEKVRYDGISKREDSLIKKLHHIVSLLPICPEVEIGMTVPREKLKLVGSLENLKMIAEETGKDWTESMMEFCQNRIVKDDFKNISGLIMKSKSPSCGMETVEVFDGGKLISEKGTGLFVSVVRRVFPSLPIIDELSLRDSNSFDNFINRVNDFANNKF